MDDILRSLISRAASQTARRLVMPQTYTPIDTAGAGLRNLLEFASDPLALLDNLMAAGTEAFATAMRQPGDAGLRLLLERGGEILRQLPAYAPLGAKPTYSGGWTQAAQAMGYVDNPEIAGAILSLLAPDPGMLGDAGRINRNLGAVIDVREAAGNPLNIVRQVGREQRKLRRQVGYWDTEVAHTVARELQQQGLLVGYRTAGVTGYGSEGAPVVFTTMFPDLAKDYRRETGAAGIIGYRIPKEAKIYQSSDENHIPTLFREAMNAGAHVIQRKKQAHELILTPKFFEDFPQIRPEPVRMTGKAPLTPFKPTVEPATEGGQPNLANRLISQNEPTVSPALEQFVDRRLITREPVVEMPGIVGSNIDDLQYIAKSNNAELIIVDTPRGKRVLALNYKGVASPSEAGALTLLQSAPTQPFRLDYASELIDVKPSVNAPPFASTVFVQPYRGDFERWKTAMQSRGFSPSPDVNEFAEFLASPNKLPQFGPPMNIDALPESASYVLSPHQVEALRRGEKVLPSKVENQTKTIQRIYEHTGYAPVMYFVQPKREIKAGALLGKDDVQEVYAATLLSMSELYDGDYAVWDVTQRVLSPPQATRASATISGATQERIKRYIENQLAQNKQVFELPKDVIRSIRVGSKTKPIGQSVIINTPTDRHHIMVIGNEDEREQMIKVFQDIKYYPHAYNYIADVYGLKPSYPNKPFLNIMWAPQKFDEVSNIYVTELDRLPSALAQKRITFDEYMEYQKDGGVKPTILSPIEVEALRQGRSVVGRRDNDWHGNRLYERLKNFKGAVDRRVPIIYMAFTNKRRREINLQDINRLVALIPYEVADSSGPYSSEYFDVTHLLFNNLQLDDLARGK